MKWTTRTGLGIVLILLATTNVFAGPPFLTNDTGVTSYQQFQVYLYSMSSSDSVGTFIQAPAGELDWGFAPNFEASLVVPYTVWFPAIGSDATGLGDSYASVEYRFWQESTYLPAIAIAPQITIPSGNASRELGNGTIAYQLPIWFQKTIGSWTIDTGGGYNFNSATDAYNNGFAGFLLQKQLNQKLTLGGELFYQGSFGVGYSPYTLLNVGGSYNFTPNFSFLFSVGNSIAGQQTFVSYFGLYWQTS